MLLFPGLNQNQITTQRSGCNLEKRSDGKSEMTFSLKKETSSRAYLYNGLEHLIELNIITPDDKIAYLGGGFGEGKGTTFLEINRVADVLENYDHYDLPNLENPEK